MRGQASFANVLVIWTLFQLVTFIWIVLVHNNNTDHGKTVSPPYDPLAYVHECMKRGSF